MRSVKCLRRRPPSQPEPLSKHERAYWGESSSAFSPSVATQRRSFMTSVAATAQQDPHLPWSLTVPKSREHFGYATRASKLVGSLLSFARNSTLPSAGSLVKKWCTPCVSSDEACGESGTRRLTSLGGKTPRMVLFSLLERAAVELEARMKSDNSTSSTLKFSSLMCLVRKRMAFVSDISQSGYLRSNGKTSATKRLNFFASAPSLESAPPSKTQPSRGPLRDKLHESPRLIQHPRHHPIVSS